MAYSQDTIILITGKHILTRSYEIDNFNRELHYKNKKNKEKNIFIDNVFSVIDSAGHEKILYNPDNNNIYKYSVTEMRDFMQGGYNASENFKSPSSTLLGFLAGAGTTVIIQNPVYSILPAGGICVLIGLPKVSQNKIFKKTPEYDANLFYASGYNQEAKNKRFINSVKGAGIGIIAGIAIIILQHNNIVPVISFN